MPNKPPTFKPLTSTSSKPAMQIWQLRRGSARSRGYDDDWNNFSEKLKHYVEYRICAICGRASQVLDHVIALNGPNDPNRFNLDDIQPLCHRCHNRKGVRFDGLYGKPRDTSDDGKREMQRMLADAKARAERYQARIADEMRA